MTMTDEVVKGAMSGHVFEQTEVASYKALIAAGQAVGDEETVRCRELVLPQENKMVEWRLEHLPYIVTAYLSRSADGRDDAKR
jgi:ferritin-like metal-binding protein YciE